MNLGGLRGFNLGLTLIMWYSKRASRKGEGLVERRETHLESDWNCQQEIIKCN